MHSQKVLASSLGLITTSKLLFTTTALSPAVVENIYEINVL